MNLGLCSIIGTLVAWGLVATVTKPSSAASTQRDLGRRFRQLDRYPDRVTVLDVENLMLSESVPIATVQRVMARARYARMTARTMWRWAHAHGTVRLVLVVDAGVAEDTLLDHLDAGTAPDWTTLHLFAGLATDAVPAGIPIDELVDLDVVLSLDDLTFLEDLADWSTASPDPGELRRFDQLPPIAGPGLAPSPPIFAWDDGDDDRPAVA